MAQSTRTDKTSRKCIRCKKTKPNNEHNFKRKKSTMNLADSIDVMCRDCRNKQYSKAENEKRKTTRRPTMIECRNRNCTKMVDKIGFKLYCTDECRHDQTSHNAKMKRKDEIALKGSTKPIPQKFLERGKIYGVDY